MILCKNIILFTLLLIGINTAYAITLGYDSTISGCDNINIRHDLLRKIKLHVNVSDVHTPDDFPIFESASGIKFNPEPQYDNLLGVGKCGAYTANHPFVIDNKEMTMKWMNIQADYKHEKKCGKYIGYLHITNIGTQGTVCVIKLKEI